MIAIYNQLDSKAAKRSRITKSMYIQQITASDITEWDSLDDIAESFEKRGLKPQPTLGEDHELVLQMALLNRQTPR
jgi:hypothetical protein